MIILFFILFIISAGYLLVNLFAKEYPVVRKISLGFLLFDGIYILALFILGFLGVIYSKQVVMGLLIVSNIFLLLANWFKYRNEMFKILLGPSPLRFSRPEFFIFVFLLIVPIIANFYWPVKDWDALALYDARARFIVFQQGNLVSAFKILSPYYFSYPLFTTLNHYLVYLFGGENPMFIYTLICTTFLITFYYLVADKIDKKTAFFCTVLVGISSRIFEHSMIAYTNLPYAIYLIIGLIYLSHFFSSHRMRDLTFSSTLIGIGTFIRSEESFWVVVTTALIFTFLGEKIKKLKVKWFYIPLFLSIVLVFVIPWELFKKRMGIGNDTLYTFDSIATHSVSLFFSGFQLGYLKDLFIHFWRYSLRFDIYLLIGYIISVIIAKDKFKIKTILSSEIYQIVLLCLIYLFLLGGSLVLRIRFPVDHWWALGGSMERLTMFIAPLLIYFTAVNIFRRHEDFHDD